MYTPFDKMILDTGSWILDISETLLIYHLRYALAGIMNGRHSQAPTPSFRRKPESRGFDYGCFLLDLPVPSETGFAPMKWYPDFMG